MDWSLPGPSLQGLLQARILGCHFLLQAYSGDNNAYIMRQMRTSNVSTTVKPFQKLKSAQNVRLHGSQYVVRRYSLEDRRSGSTLPCVILGKPLRVRRRKSEDAGAVGLSLTTYWLTTWATDIHVSLSISSLVKWDQQQPHRFVCRAEGHLTYVKYPVWYLVYMMPLWIGLLFKNKVWKKNPPLSTREWIWSWKWNHSILYIGQFRPKSLGSKICIFFQHYWGHTKQ